MKRSAMVSLVIAASVAAGCGGGGSTGGLDSEAVYNVALSPATEVPTPKPTAASGSAQIILYPASVDFQLSATTITGITMAHIHSGAPGVAGPVVATLFLPPSPTGAVNGVFASGSLTDSDLPGGSTIQSLKQLIKSGNTYVNVHTSANPTGEIRGQIK